MNDKRIKNISKFLSLVLRHKPGAIGLNLDAQGWVKVDELLEKLATHKKGISLEELEVVVENNNKKRFAFSEDKTKIRANQGHSIKLDLGYSPVEPPEFLYHGTASRFLVKYSKNWFGKKKSPSCTSFLGVRNSQRCWRQTWKTYDSDYSFKGNASSRFSILCLG